MKTNVIKRIVTTCCATLAVLSMAACSGPSSAGSDTSDSSTLTVGVTSQVKNIDPIYAYDFVTSPVTNQITESLLQFDKNDKIQPMLAKSWEQKDDTTYVYQIRDNVKFSDGNPMTMDDVVYSLERYRNPDLASYVAWMYDNVDTIKQTGDWELTVKLKQPDALWKYASATSGTGIVEKSVVEKYGKDYGTVNGIPIGTGAYVVKNWASGGDVTLEYNKDYWDKSESGDPDVKKIVFRPIEEDSTRVAASTSGQIDLDLQTPVDMIDQVKNSSKVKLAKIPSAGLNYISFNTKKAPFDDVNARKAVAAAINVGDIQKSIIKDAGVATNYLLDPETLFLFNKDEWTSYEKSADVVKYNVDKAKEYLSKSKYPDGFSFDMTVMSKSLPNNVVLAMQQDLKKVGITLNIKKVSNDEATSQQFGSGIENGVRPYQALMTEWSSDFPDPAGNLTPLLASTGGGDGGSNSAQYENSQVDDLLNQQVRSSDDSERTKLLTQIMDIENQDLPYYVYTHQNWLFTYNPKIKNGVADASPFWFWNMYIKNFKISK
ncbi:Bacterial extracellular solute-binding protein, family 5 Middle [Bifidobacterium goeldii]|uniref:Bacterial extracellular solute-binding protein, family 5 Middle n=1 Tax=Bifidobacterium goeldii TaxID=2306975 RepID=A0A430FIT9_9BIFI|nr:ABC transporter substrate-binding protein [Bifidobacterium goeldii]RSX52815.1 Bacterial extracellular solute-binding protein, family 5 Middle [Bifidobacterium goeldii]